MANDTGTEIHYTEGKASEANYCPNCHVSVDPSLENCPLCRRHLTDTPSQDRMYPEPTDATSSVRPRDFFEDLLIFLSAAFLCGSVVLNIVYWQGKPWCLSVASLILYVWIVVWENVYRRYYFGTQVLTQLCGLTLVFVSFDISAGWTGWSLNHVIPVLLMTCNVLIDLYSGMYKSRWKDNLMYALLFAVLGFVPMILYFAKVTTAWLPMALAALSSTISILGMLRFAVRTLVQEMKKRFHI